MEQMWTLFSYLLKYDLGTYGMILTQNTRMGSLSFGYMFR